MYLFMAVLGVLCCSAFFCSCSEWGLLSSCGERASHCSGFSCWRAQSSGSSGCRSRSTWTQQLQLPGSVAQAQQLLGLVGLSCSMAYRILLDQGSNPHLLHQWVNSSPLSQEGNPAIAFKLPFVPQLYHPIGGRKSPSPGFKQRSRL